MGMEINSAVLKWQIGKVRNEINRLIFEITTPLTMRFMTRSLATIMRSLANEISRL